MAHHTNSFKGKNFLKTIDFSKEQLLELINCSLTLKQLKRQSIEHQVLKGKSIALIFHKPSTRASFSVAAHDLGMHVDYFGENELHLGKKESVYDTAQVLSRMYDGIEYRGYQQSDIEALGKYSKVPVWNGLTDEWHPTQMIADYLTLREQWGTLEGKTLTYIGDARNNVANDLLVTGAMLGVNVNIIAPESLFPSDYVVQLAQDYAQKSGSHIVISSNIESTIRHTDAIYTDVWFSMGESADLIGPRIELLKPYQVNQSLIKMTDNPQVKVLHCLPAFHNTDTQIGQDIYNQYGLTEMEITDDVFNSEYSVVFEQAENRLHSIKAIMALTLGGIESALSLSKV